MTRMTRRWGGGLPLVLLLLAGAWLAGLVAFAEAIPDRSADDGRTTDAIVVLTGGSGRIEVGLEQLAQDRAKKLFVSGVPHGVTPPELPGLATAAPDQLACCVVLGHEASNTTGNARETAAWMMSEGFRSLRLVTSNYHMPRSLLEFRRAMPGMEIVAHPVIPESVRQNDWWRWPGTTMLIVTEYSKYLLALARDWAEEILAPRAAAGTP